MEILRHNFDDLPGIGEVTWIPSKISISVTQEQIEQNTIHGVDTEKIIRNAVASEAFMSLSKLVSKTVFDKEFQDIKLEKDKDWLSQVLSEKTSFILTNVKIGIDIQEIWGFETKLKDTKFSSNAGGIYKLGMFRNIPVYIANVKI
jgi:hypothetical protein